jgi:hypothetical protein
VRAQQKVEYRNLWKVRFAFRVATGFLMARRHLNPSVCNSAAFFFDVTRLEARSCQTVQSAFELARPAPTQTEVQHSDLADLAGKPKGLVRYLDVRCKLQHQTLNENEVSAFLISSQLSAYAIKLLLGFALNGTCTKNYRISTPTNPPYSVFLTSANSPRSACP